MNHILKIALAIIFIGCTSSDDNYTDVSSKKNDIDFYKLVEVQFQDDASLGNISIPDFMTLIIPEEDDAILQGVYFEEESGYSISIEKLETRNTQKLSDKQYLDICREGFENDMNGDLSEVERILSPLMENVRVVQLDANLIINNKYFLRRVSYFKDGRLKGTVLEDVNCTNFHFVTLHNKRKYSFNINYFGNDKSISELTALFNTIGGSISFNN